MSLSTDRYPKQILSSHASRVLLRLRPQIEETWARRARRELKSAAQLAEPILMNTLPMYLENIAEALTPQHARKSGTDMTSVAQEHGGERARMTNYDINQLIVEYHLLRDTLVETMEKEMVLSKEELQIIDRSFNSAIKDAVMAFSLVESKLREQFIATVTHDIRNPLGAIRLAAELLQEEIKLEAGSAELCKIILNNSIKAEKLLRNILDTSLVNSGGRVKLDVKLCDLKEIAERCAADSRLRHDIQIAIRGPSVKGYWSADDLERALDNLLSNAIKYGDLSRPIEILIHEIHGRVALSVHNEGAEIPLEEQDHIFQAFRRSNSAKQGKSEGWGLGLAQVRGVAEAHGGSVIVDSGPERGTTFTIDIPLDARTWSRVPLVN